MEVYGYDPFISIDAAWNLSRSVKHAKSLTDIYKNCDYISVHVPLNDKTRHMIDEKAISEMKEGVHLLNFARGELIADQDVIAAIESGKISTYVTDFPNDALAKVEQVITIPHLGASTNEAEENCVVKAVEELKDFLENGNITNSVNFPNVAMERGEGERIAVIHRNIPSMLAQIADTLAKNNVNIANMINKSKNDYAYTLIDLDNQIDEAKLADLQSIEGIIRVNVYPAV